MRAARLLAVLLLLALVQGTPAHASSSAGPNVPVSPTGTVVARAPLPVVTGTTPAEIDGPLATDVQWTRWSRLVRFGQAAVLEGQVLVADGSLPDAPVRLLARPVGTDRWSTVAQSRTTTDTGVFAFEGVRPEANTDYRVEYGGNLLYASSTADRRVPVARRVRDSITRLSDGDFRLAGSVAPRAAGQRVLLQRRTCESCAWRTVSRTSTNRRSRWGFEVAAPARKGTWWYRAAVPADPRFVRSYSDHVWSVTRF